MAAAKERSKRSRTRLGWGLLAVALLFAALPLRDGAPPSTSAQPTAPAPGPHVRDLTRDPAVPLGGHSDDANLESFEHSVRPALARFLREQARSGTGAQQVLALARRDVSSAQALGAAT